MKKLFSIDTLFFTFRGLRAHAGDNMKAFPPVGKGMVRYGLQLPKQDDESAFKVELIVDKTVLLDEHNRYFFGGRARYNWKVLLSGYARSMLTNKGCSALAFFLRRSGNSASSIPKH